MSLLRSSARPLRSRPLSLALRLVSMVPYAEAKTNVHETPAGRMELRHARKRDNPGEDTPETAGIRLPPCTRCENARVPSPSPSIPTTHGDCARRALVPRPAIRDLRHAAIAPHGIRAPEVR